MKLGTWAGILAAGLLFVVPSAALGRDGHSDHRRDHGGSPNRYPPSSAPSPWSPPDSPAPTMPASAPSPAPLPPNALMAPWSREMLPPSYFPHPGAIAADLLRKLTLDWIPGFGPGKGPCALWASPLGPGATDKPVSAAADVVRKDALNWIPGYGSGEPVSAQDGTGASAEAGRDTRPASAAADPERRGKMKWAPGFGPSTIPPGGAFTASGELKITQPDSLSRPDAKPVSPATDLERRQKMNWIPGYGPRK